MKKRNFIFLVILAALAEAAWGASFAFFGVKPSLLLICVVIASLKAEPSFAFWVGVACGCLKDSWGVSGFGIQTVMYPLTALAVITLSRKVAIDTTYLISFTVFILSLAYNFVMRITLSFFGSSVAPLTFMRVAFLEALYTAVFVWPLMRVVKKVA